LKNSERDVLPGADNALALLCWFNPDKMKAHFKSELERVYAPPRWGRHEPCR
jgi:hypothetical protein